jgi:DNA mismatch endonuclease (patch repair protein)
MDTVDAATRSRIMSRIRSKHTGPELALAAALRRAGHWGWRRHRRVAGAELDFAWARARLGVRVNGCFWHRHSCGRCRIPKTRRAFWTKKLGRNAERDQEQARAVRAAGWRLLTVWECQLTDSGPEAHAATIGARLRAESLRLSNRLLARPEHCGIRWRRSWRTR